MESEGARSLRNLRENLRIPKGPALRQTWVMGDVWNLRFPKLNVAGSNPVARSSTTREVGVGYDGGCFDARARADTLCHFGANIDVRSGPLLSACVRPPDASWHRG